MCARMATKTSSPSAGSLWAAPSAKPSTRVWSESAHEGGQPQRVDVAAGGLVRVVVAGVLAEAVGRRRRVAEQPLGRARLGADVDQDEALEQEEEEEPGHRPGDDVRAAQVHRLGQHVEEGGAEHDAGREGEQRRRCGSAGR